jgi:hypothetical protein
MSRTYRRKDNQAYLEIHWAEYKACKKLNSDSWLTNRNSRKITDPEVLKVAKSLYFSDSYRTMTTPMWWNREMVQVPYRSYERNKLRDIVKTSIEDLEEYPDLRHPKYHAHVYYW